MTSTIWPAQAAVVPSKASAASVASGVNVAGEATKANSVTSGLHAVETKDLSVFYGTFQAVKCVDLDVEKQRVTALIGPSGCGKSTVLRCFNRMNDLIPTARVEGTVLFRGQNLYGPNVDAVAVRRHIGMVFQKPNPFPKSIYENVAVGREDQRLQGEHGRARRKVVA